MFDSNSIGPEKLDDDTKTGQAPLHWYSNTTVSRSVTSPSFWTTVFIKMSTVIFVFSFNLRGSKRAPLSAGSLFKCPQQSQEPGIQFSSPTRMAGAHILDPFSLTPWVHISKKLESGAWAGDELQALGCGIWTSWLAS